MTIKKIILAAGLTLATATTASAFQQDGGYFQLENPPIDVSADAPNWSWFIVQEGDVVSNAVHSFVKSAELTASWMQVLPAVTTMNRHYGDATFNPNEVVPGQRILLPVNVPTNGATTATAASSEGTTAAVVDYTDPDVIRNQLAAANMPEVLWGLGVPMLQGHRTQDIAIDDLRKKAADQAIFQQSVEAWQTAFSKDVTQGFIDLSGAVNVNTANISTQGEVLAAQGETLAAQDVRLGQLELVKPAPLSDVVGQFSQWLEVTEVGQQLGVTAKTLTTIWQQWWEVIFIAAAVTMLAIFGLIGRIRIMRRMKKNRLADQIMVDDAFGGIVTKLDQVKADQARTHGLAESAATAVAQANQRIDYVVDATAPALFDRSLVSKQALTELAFNQPFVLLVAAKDGSQEWQLAIEKVMHNFGDGKLVEAIVIHGLSRRDDVFDQKPAVKKFGQVQGLIEEGVFKGCLQNTEVAARAIKVEKLQSTTTAE